MTPDPMSPIPTARRMPDAASQAGFSRFTPVDPLRILRQRAGLLAGTLIVSIVMGLGVWFLLDRFLPKYTSVTQLTVTGGVSDPYELLQQSSGGFGRTGMEMIDAFIMNQTIRLTSEEIVVETLKRDTVRATAWFRDFVESGGSGNIDIREVSRQLRSDLVARRIRGSTLIDVTFTSGQQQDPPIILDNLIDVYLQKIKIETGSEADKVRSAFVQERDRSEEHQRQVEEQMKQFMIQHDLPSLETRNNEATIGYQLLAQQMAELELALQSARETYPSLVNAQRSGTVGYSPQALAQVEADPTVVVYTNRISFFREQRSVLLERFGDKHRSVRQTDLQVAAAESEKNEQMDRLLRKRQAVEIEQAKKLMDGLESQIQSLQPSMENSRAEIRDLSQRLEEFRRIRVRAQLATERLRKADDLLNAMRIQSERPDSTQVRVLFRATEANKSFPRLTMVVASAVFLMMGTVAGVVFLKEALDQRIKSPGDVVLPQTCSLLGVIPDSAEDPSSSSEMAGIVRTSPTGLIAESFPASPHGFAHGIGPARR